MWPIRWVRQRSAPAGERLTSAARRRRRGRMPVAGQHAEDDLIGEAPVDPRRAAQGAFGHESGPGCRRDHRGVVGQRLGLEPLQAQDGEAVTAEQPDGVRAQAPATEAGRSEIPRWAERLCRSMPHRSASPARSPVASCTTENTALSSRRPATWTATQHSAGSAARAANQPGPTSPRRRAAPHAEPGHRSPPGPAARPLLRAAWDVPTGPDAEQQSHCRGRRGPGGHEPQPPLPAARVTRVGWLAGEARTSTGMQPRRSVT